MAVIKIGRPCSPSTVKSVDKLTATMIVVSYGGGIGGANTTYYCSEAAWNPEEVGFMRVKDLFTGDSIDINSRFIVTKKIVTLIKRVTDATAWANYNKVVCKSSIRTDYFEIGNKDTIVQYDGTDTGEKFIHVETEQS